MSYKFIHPASKLTTQQKNFYEKNGYIVIKNNVDHELLDKCFERFVEICEENSELKGLTYSHLVRDPILKKRGASGQYQVNKLQDFANDEVLSQYMTLKSIVDVVENIIGPNITAVHSMLINKPPDSDPDFSKHPLHQDLLYFPFRPKEKIIASWTAMEDCYADNGCLYVIPGSHTSSVLPHQYPKGNKNKMYVGVEGQDHVPKVDLIMEKGDTVFFSSSLLHGSYPNRTKNFRKAISCHYADTNCNFIDVKGTPLEQMAKELEDTIWNKAKIKMSAQDFWKMKSKLIRGQPGEFQRFDNHL